MLLRATTAVCALLFVLQLNAQSTITKYEYWWDNDIPNKTSVPLAAVPMLEQTLLLDVQHLSNGLHNLNMRFYDSDGLWSVLTTNYFYYNSFNTEAFNNKITGYRYWFDTLNTQIFSDTFAVALTHQNLFLDVHVPAALDSGKHTICFQFIDTKKQWSTPVVDTIMVVPPCEVVKTFNDLETFHYANCAIQHLYSEGLVAGDGNTNYTTIRPDSSINRAELAKLAYLSIDLQNNSIADKFPSPFIDLEAGTWYANYAKNLSYLEFGDGISPFDKNKALPNFYPSKNISRAHVLKVLLETWYVALLSDSTHFTDVPTTHDAYAYIATAESLGIVKGDDNNGLTFRPNDMATRAEVFVMLYRMLLHQTLTKPTVTANDFYEPGNYTLTNLANFNGSHSGNFKNYTKNSFAIAGIGLPLSFEHTYNSYGLDMPGALYAVEPLGKLWSHTYNSYLLEIPADEDPENTENTIVVHLPSGAFHAYRSTTNNYDIGSTYQNVTQGIYNTLKKVNASKYEVTTKTQISYVYEQQGTGTVFYLTSITDRNGNTVTIQYEDATQQVLKRINKVTGTAGRELVFSYHANTDLLQKVSDPANREISFTYYNKTDVHTAQLNTFTDAMNNETVYDYGTGAEAFLLLNITLPKGNTITNTYAQKKLASTQTNGQLVSSYAYQRNYQQTGLNNFVQVVQTDANNTTTNLSFKKDGTLESVTSPELNASINYDVLHPNKPENIAVNGQTISATYDTFGNVTEVNLPEGVTHVFSYNIRNDLLEYTDPRGKKYSYSYNNSGNLTAVTTPRGTTTYGVNNNGTIQSVTTPTNIITSFLYDVYGNVQDINMPENINTTAKYDVLGRVTEITLPNGSKKTYTYDANDNTLSENHVYTTAYAYNANNLLEKITNAKGVATNLVYDFDNDYLTEIEFDGMRDRYTYDDLGRLITKTTPGNTTFSYNYVADKNLVESVSGGGKSTNYEYDTKNNVTKVSYNGTNTQFWYDELDRITKTEDMYGQIVEYTFDENSNITSITYLGNKTVSYTYWDDNLLKSLTDWNGKKVQYNYRVDGKLTNISYPNGTQCSYDYDNVGRNNNILWLQANGDTIAWYSFIHDAMGNIVEEHRKEPLPFPAMDDYLGNYQYNNKNQITTDTEGVYATDGNGNITSIRGNALSWSEKDQLISAYGNTYIYDGLGYRRQKSSNGNTTRYVMDISGIGDVLIETDGANTPENYYVHGIGLCYRINANGTYEYYHGDARGSTIAISDDTGNNLTHKYVYDVYGKVLNEVETTPNAYRYVGMWGVQAETGNIYFMRARYYQADIGRFLSEDPIWSTNLYPYANGNPVTNFDINGKKSEKLQGQKTLFALADDEYVEAFKLNSYHSAAATKGKLGMKFTTAKISNMKPIEQINLEFSAMEGEAEAHYEFNKNQVSVGGGATVMFTQAGGVFDLSSIIPFEVSGFVGAGIGGSFDVSLGKKTEIGGSVGFATASIAYKYNNKSWMAKSGKWISSLASEEFSTAIYIFFKDKGLTE